MADSRTKNASRNILFGSINKLVTLVLPFVTRTIILHLLGAAYLGIGTLFSSILSFLSLAELGVGAAIAFSMYRPIAEGDDAAVGALLHYYKRFYRIIGLAVLGIGTVLLPALPYLMKDEAPQGVNAYILYYIYLINSVISYFFAGYRQSLLSAHQRADITNKITTAVSVVVQFGQIAVLYLTKNFYAYALVPICGTLVINTLNAIITRKKYPNIKCEGDVPAETKKEIQTKISGLFGTKLNSIVVHSADSMIISAFLGLVVTAQYGNYYYIMNAVCGFITVFYSSLTAGIGNKLVSDSLEENYGLFKKLSFANAWIVGWCSACFVCLYEPFIKLWVGEELQLGIEFVILMTGYFFVYEIQRTVLTFKDAAGLWYQDRIRPYVSMAVNVVSNIILVQFIGIYGIVLSTILAFMISLPWANYVLFRNVFHKPAYKNMLEIGKFFIITVAISGITYFACSVCHDGILGLLERLAICLLVPNALFALLFCRTKEFQYIWCTAKKLFKKALHR